MNWLKMMKAQQIFSKGTWPANLRIFNLENEHR